jgi:hypothetical protein
MSTYYNNQVKEVQEGTQNLEENHRFLQQNDTILHMEEFLDAMSSLFNVLQGVGLWTPKERQIDAKNLDNIKVPMWLNRVEGS